MLQFKILYPVMIQVSPRPTAFTVSYAWNSDPMKRGRSKRRSKIPVVITTEENVVISSYQMVLLLSYLKCGAVVLQEQVAVAVCTVCPLTAEDTQLTSQQL